MKKYVWKIQEVKAKLRQLQSSNSSKHGEPVDYLALDFVTSFKGLQVHHHGKWIHVVHNSLLVKCLKSK